jgi:hypothetical protein
MNSNSLKFILIVVINLVMSTSAFSSDMRTCNLIRYLLANENNKDIKSISFIPNKNYFWLFNKLVALSSKDMLEAFTPLAGEVSQIIGRYNCGINPTQVLQEFFDSARKSEIIHITYKDGQVGYYSIPFLVAKCNILVIYERKRKTTAKVFPASGEESILFLLDERDNLKLLGKMVIIHHD